MRRSALETSFASTLVAWLEERDEILIMLRYPFAGGARDYELHSSIVSIAKRLSEVPAQTSVIAFREPQLPLRGVVTPGFVNLVLATIPDGEEFLVVETTPTTMGLHSWYRNAGGQWHSELREELEGSMGKPVLLGRYPPWLEDGPDVISGYVPDSAGRISPGAY